MEMRILKFLYIMIRTIKTCLTFAVAVTVSSCTATGQQQVNDFLNLDTVLNLKQRLFDIADICTCKDGNDVYFINYNTRLHCDSLYLYQLNTETIRLDSYLIALPDMTQLLKNHNCHRWSSIACNGKNLLLTTGQTQYIYKNINGKYIFAKQWNKENDARYCTFLNDSIIAFWDMYYGNKPETFIGLYNLSGGNITKHISPYFFHPLLCYHKPYHLVDINNGLILFANKGIYSIVLYNNYLDSTSHIQREIAEWSKLPEKKINSIIKRYNANDAMDIIIEEEKWLHTIHQFFGAYWIDTNKFIAIYQTPYPKNGHRKAFVDIWENKNGTFILKQKDIADNCGIYVDTDSIIGPHSFGLAIQSANIFIFTQKKQLFSEILVLLLILLG